MKKILVFLLISLAAKAQLSSKAEVVLVTVAPGKELHSAFGHTILWVNDPANIPWETFHTLDTIPVFNDTASAGCCVPELVAVKEPQSSCCTPSTASSKKSCC